MCEILNFARKIKNNNFWISCHRDELQPPYLQMHHYLAVMS